MVSVTITALDSAPRKSGGRESDALLTSTTDFKGSGTIEEGEAEEEDSSEAGMMEKEEEGERGEQAKRGSPKLRKTRM